MYAWATPDNMDENWLLKLDRLKELRGKGREFDRAHMEAVLDAAYVDGTFMIMVMEGEFELAREWIVKSLKVDKPNDD